MSDIAVAMTTEIQPPPERKPRKTKAKSDPSRQPRGPARPHRALPEDVLASRTAKLMARLEKAKKQHEATRLLLTKYAHERFYRERDAIQNAATESAPPGPPALSDDPTPLPS